ncbi:unnamed protein product [Lepeophtheirus salmonis]|uniref:(salmon louse) hypothetical protein n=1 Tax=Lepeophtheirus salmonis TaxID=72036 RepID=A0A7R8H816_LEPSM|nr:unnamed protein product [Lepeophtheirus salmonis]CAF2929245.1 unnamed protein product [Lepeophtheirus salmonis]
MKKSPEAPMTKAITNTTNHTEEGSLSPSCSKNKKKHLTNSYRVATSPYQLPPIPTQCFELKRCYTHSQLLNPPLLLLSPWCESIYRSWILVYHKSHSTMSIIATRRAKTPSRDPTTDTGIRTELYFLRSSMDLHMAMGGCIYDISSKWGCASILRVQVNALKRIVQQMDNIRNY